MGYADFKTAMDSRTGSISSGLGSRSGLRGQTLKSSPFCPRSSSKLAQSIIKDHMVSHYRRIYSAKAAIDTSVPKSLLQSVKYNDQIKKERQRKGPRPASALSFSQRNCHTSCSSAQSQLSVQYGASPYRCSRSSVLSIPKFTTSFNPKDVVYPAGKVTSHHSRPSSEMKYQSPEGAFQRKQSACSLEVLRDQGGYKTFQDPVKKTYSGDLLQKHSQHFTREKPFTPKTLKSDKISYLSKYRYYRAPQIQSPHYASNSGQLQQETCERSTENNEFTQDLDEPTQEYFTEPEWFEDPINGTYSSPSEKQSWKTKPSSSRILTEDMKSANRSRISAEEEELLYLEFISSVTEDILSRGHISDSMVDRVMRRHIDMNLHRLDEGKMRHLLEVLRTELEMPTSITSYSTEHQKKEKDLLDSEFSHLEWEWKQRKTEENYDILTHRVQIENFDLLQNDNPSLISAPLSSPLRTISSTKTDEKEKEGDNNEEGISSNNNPDNNQELFHPANATAIDVHDESYTHTTTNNDQKQTGSRVDGQSNELEDLGNNLSEVLHVSSDSDNDF